MILGSHNSWSFLRYKKWWMRLFSFVARCQECSIKDQYEKYGVRCFDLRVKFDKDGNPIFSHGSFVYDCSLDDIMNDLACVDVKGDCYIRVLHEARTKKEYNDKSIDCFIEFCRSVCKLFPNIKFWCGKNLYNWTNDYTFGNDPSCEELYSSVCPPKIIDDWYPKYYAKHHNHENIERGTDKDILLIDFVNIQ